MHQRALHKWLTALAFSTATLTAVAQVMLPSSDSQTLNKAYTGKVYSPYAKRDFANNVYFGDTHLHTDVSMDAGAFGDRLGPDVAYRFARGEQVNSTRGGPARLSRPLDFLVVADHSDNMGFFPDLLEGAPHIVADPTGKDWYTRIRAGKGVDVALEIIDQFSRGKFPAALTYTPDSQQYRNAWNNTVKTADQFNEPGRFTAFIGYEWTAMEKGNNLHRVVVFRDGADKGSQVVPFTTVPPQGSPDPSKLWEWMAQYERKTNGKVLAIAHNGNLSNGMMFPLDIRSDGKPLDALYARERSKWEPLYEATQIKGDGESHPFLSPDDEFANFETWDVGNLDLSQAKTNDMLAGEYAREGLKRGLLLQNKFGINPYKFGMIGSTDSHTSLSTAEEDNFFGKTTASEPSPDRMTLAFMDTPQGKIMDWQMAASGLTAVWAKENTRAALFDAMERKEVYATTGSRMTVRLFGGWNFTPADLNNREPAFVGYAKGVPMGGDLPEDTGARAPSFMVFAMRDAIGANLDRIQIVKGWLDGDTTHEKVYDVVWSGDRKIGPNGKLPPVGNTVNVATASWTNTIGAPELGTVWTDPDFKPNQRAFYYARVLEIPKPRWTTYDAFRFGVPIPDGAPTSIQDRAYTSPIWYNP
jgi:hypothetical protein